MRGPDDTERLRATRRGFLDACAQLTDRPGSVEALERARVAVDALDLAAVVVLGRFASVQLRRWAREQVGAALVGAYQDSEPRPMVRDLLEAA